MIPVYHYLLISAVLFAIGIFGVLTRRNAIVVLMSIELILNAANINLVAFNKFWGNADGQGQVFSLFVIAIAAASSVVGLILVISVYRHTRSIFLDNANLMKW